VPGAEKLVTQRVIEVPMAPLLAGSAQFNIVVRPGDVIRVPSAPEGIVYVMGEVNRPGTYSLPSNGRLTIERAIASAGGLSNIAIPERMDLTRMVAPDRQATIRLNYRAIAERTMPDIFLKPDDVINVGTNFWAFPLAVIRQGFRFSYGFGFVLDRNFDEEVFGPRQGTR
jgi:polysaccharide export outer membrane protein